MVSTKEDLLLLMAGGRIKLSNQDACFFQTLHGLIFRKKQITSNQAKLFNKLIIKYKAQLKYKGLVAHDLLGLPWKTSVIESDPKFTDPNIRLIDGMLHFRIPFNKSFVTDLHKTDYNFFKWDRTERNYKAKFNTACLKVAVELSHKHFGKLNYCPAIQELLNDVLVNKEGYFWTPTLCRSGDRYYIAASNDIINRQVEDITLDDHPITLYKLSQMAINIDPKIIGDDPFKKFASEYHVVTDTSQYAVIAGWLNELQVQTVIGSRELAYTKQVRTEMTNELKKYGIKFLPPDMIDNLTETVMMQFHQGVWGNDGVSKVIVVKNSRPVNIQ